MIDRCLTEVFFCKEIDILGYQHDHGSPYHCSGGIHDMTGFFRLPCVLACQKLTLLKGVETYGMNAEDVVFWLNTAVGYGPKELLCYKKFFFDATVSFTTLLIKVINEKDIIINNTTLNIYY